MSGSLRVGGSWVVRVGVSGVYGDWGGIVVITVVFNGTAVDFGLDFNGGFGIKLVVFARIVLLRLFESKLPMPNFDKIFVKLVLTIIFLGLGDVRFGGNDSSFVLCFDLIPCACFVVFLPAL